jgi:hypothetical protein
MSAAHYKPLKDKTMVISKSKEVINREKISTTQRSKSCFPSIRKSYYKSMGWD